MDRSLKDMERRGVIHDAEETWQTCVLGVVIFAVVVGLVLLAAFGG